MPPYTSCFLLPNFSGGGGTDKHLLIPDALSMADQRNHHSHLYKRPTYQATEFIGGAYRSMGEGLPKGARVTQRQRCHQRIHPNKGEDSKAVSLELLTWLAGNWQAGKFPLPSSSYCLCKLGEAPSESYKFQELPETRELLASWALLVWLIPWVLESLSKMEFSNREEITVQHLCTERAHSVTIP